MAHQVLMFAFRAGVFVFLAVVPVANPFAQRIFFASPNRGRLVMRNPPEDGFQKDKAAVVFFTGCVSAYFPLAQKIPIALAEIFTASGVDFTLLGKDEWCCGFPLVGAGLGEGLPAFIEHNLEAVRRKGAQKIVFTCPSCYQIWREAYPPEFEAQHGTSGGKDARDIEPGQHLNETAEGSGTGQSSAGYGLYDVGPPY